MALPAPSENEGAPELAPVGPRLWPRVVAGGPQNHTPTPSPVGVSAGAWGWMPGRPSRPENSGGENAAEPRRIVQDPAGSPHHRCQRVVVTPDRQTGLVDEELVQAADQGSTPGEHDPLFEDVARQLGRRHLQRSSNGVDDAGERLLHRVADA